MSIKSLIKFGRTPPPVTEPHPPQARIRALTLHRPWSHILGRHYPATHSLPKRYPHRMIEHRSWDPARRGLKSGDWIAIHAGKTIDLPNALESFPASFRKHIPQSGWGNAGELTCLLRYQKFISSAWQLPRKQHRWYQKGESAWVFDDFIKFDPPILHGNGAQGLWYPPATTQTLLLAAITQHTPIHDR